MKRGNEDSIDDDLKISVATDFEQIEAIRPIWEEMQSKEVYAVPNSDIDRYLAVLQAKKDEMQPYVMVLSKRGSTVAVIVGRIENRRIECKIGYKTIVRPSLRCLSVIYGGILGNPSSLTCRAVVTQLISALLSGEADVVWLNNLKIDSNMYQIAKKLPSSLQRNHFHRIDPHWFMSVPENIGLFYKTRSKKHRSNLKRYIKKLENEYPDQFKVVTYTKEEDLGDAIKAVSEISRTTYQHGLGYGLVDNFKTRLLLTTSAKHGWLRMAVLYINGNPCAFQVGLHYRRRYFAEQMGFDPRWKKFCVGTVLFLKVLEGLCSDPNIDCYDFGFGDADYKQSYGDIQWRESSLCIFAPRLRPVCINLLQSVLSGLSLFLNCLSNKTGFMRWVKRRWRDRLQEQKK